MVPRTGLIRVLPCQNCRRLTEQVFGRATDTMWACDVCGTLTFVAGREPAVPTLKESEVRGLLDEVKLRVFCLIGRVRSSVRLADVAVSLQGVLDSGSKDTGYFRAGFRFGDREVHLSASLSDQQEMALQILDVDVHQGGVEIARERLIDGEHNRETKLTWFSRKVASRLLPGLSEGV